MQVNNVVGYSQSQPPKEPSFKGYAVSKSGRYLAWVEPALKYSSSKINLEDLKTGITYEVTSDEGTYVLPIAFIGEDFVYGVANVAEVKTTESFGS